MTSRPATGTGVMAGSHTAVRRVLSDALLSAAYRKGVAALRLFDWLYCEAAGDCLAVLASYEDAYDGIRTLRYDRLNASGRVRVNRGFDLLDGVQVSCVNARDVKVVRLVAEIPAQQLGHRSAATATNMTTVAVPLAVLSTPAKDCITAFFDTALPLFALPDFQLYLEVVLDSRVANDQHTVALRYVILSGAKRTAMSAHLTQLGNELAKAMLS